MKMSDEERIAAALIPLADALSGDDATLRIVPVGVLQRGDDVVYVTGALEDGQAVVIGGIRYATNGMRVRTGARQRQ